MYKILHIDRQRHWTGQQSRTYQIVKHLIRRGHEVTIACHPGAEYERRALRDGIPVVTIPMRGWSVAMAYVRLAKLMRRKRIQLVDVHGSVDHQMAAGAVQVGGRAVLIRTKHKNLKLKSGWLSRLVYNPPVTQKIIAISDAVRLQLMADGIPERNIELIYEAIDVGRFKPGPGSEFREKFGFGPEHFVIGSASRLHTSKGVDVLLEAVARLYQRHPQVRFVHAGHGSAKHYSEIARKAGVPEGVYKFAGAVEGIERFYPALDVFCLPSRSEGLGIVLLEAMACEIPAVASRVGGIPEVVDEGKTGLLVNPEDPGALARAIETFILNPALKRTYGEEGRRRVVSRFDSKDMFDRTERLYEGFLAARSGKPVEQQTELSTDHSN